MYLCCLIEIWSLEPQVPFFLLAILYSLHFYAMCHVITDIKETLIRFGAASNNASQIWYSHLIELYCGLECEYINCKLGVGVCSIWINAGCAFEQTQTS